MTATGTARRVVMLGATRGMGRALARLMAERGDHLHLLGRDGDELARSARDLEQRGAGAVATTLCDLEQPAGFNAALAAAEDALGGIDTVVVTAGLFATQEALEGDLELTRRLLDVDFARTVEFCELARRRLLAGRSADEGPATLCVFSSVAADRGRKPVVLYGAAKAGLAAYLEGLDHKFRGQGLEVICVKPGFVKTGMTAGLEPPPFAGEPEGVARQVLKAIDRGTPVVYTPGMWRWVMLVIRWLPRVVMRRIGF